MRGEQTQAERAVMEVLREIPHTAVAATVFGEPVTRGETTVIPAARISGRGGGGGGGGAEPDGHSGGGSGSGLKLSARPVGVYVMDHKGVRWQPAVDVNRVILGGQLVAIAALLVFRKALRAYLVPARRRRRVGWRRGR